MNRNRDLTPFKLIYKNISNDFIEIDSETTNSSISVIKDIFKSILSEIENLEKSYQKQDLINYYYPKSYKELKIGQEVEIFRNFTLDVWNKIVIDLNNVSSIESYDSWCTTGRMRIKREINN